MSSHSSPSPSEGSELHAQVTPPHSLSTHGVETHATKRQQQQTPSTPSSLSFHSTSSMHNGVIESYEELMKTRPSAESPVQWDKWIKRVLLPAHSNLRQAKSKPLAGKKRKQSEESSGEEDEEEEDDEDKDYHSPKRLRSNDRETSAVQTRASSANQTTTLNGHMNPSLLRQIRGSTLEPPILQSNCKTAFHRRMGRRPHMSPGPGNAASKFKKNTKEARLKLKDYDDIRHQLGLGEHFKGGAQVTITELSRIYGVKDSTGVRSAAKQALQRYHRDADTGVIWPTEWIKQQYLILKKTMTPKSHMEGTTKTSRISDENVAIKMALSDCFTAWRNEHHLQNMNKEDLCRLIRKIPSLQPLIPESDGARSALKPEIYLLVHKHPWYTSQPHVQAAQLEMLKHIDSPTGSESGSTPIKESDDEQLEGTPEPTPGPTPTPAYHAHHNPYHHAYGRPAHVPAHFYSQHPPQHYPHGPYYQPTVTLQSSYYPNQLPAQYAEAARYAEHDFKQNYTVEYGSHSSSEGIDPNLDGMLAPVGEYNHYGPVGHEYDEEIGQRVADRATGMPGNDGAVITFGPHIENPWA